jgi:hypothetical protein
MMMLLMHTTGEVSIETPLVSDPLLWMGDYYQEKQQQQQVVVVVGSGGCSTQEIAS